MPRHRIEAPRQRTLWPAAVRSARRVPFRAAGGRRSPGHAKPAVAPEWRQRFTRSQRRMLKRAGRRLLVSPWFAAGAGFVIATGAIIYVPHTQLSPAINVTPCKPASCPQQLAPQGGTGMPVGGGTPMPVPSKSSLPAGLTVWYQPGHSSWGEFSMWIEFRTRNSHWKLRFVIPGAEAIYVYGALSQPYGSDGVLVTSYDAGTESVGFAALSGLESGSDSGSGSTVYTVRFQIRGTGAVNRPIDCTFDGAACRFSLSRDLVPVAGSSG